MSLAPAVSIVVTTYNRAALLGIALQSILLQDFTDYEVWVVGDGCSDDSGAVVQALGDPRFHWINLEHNHRSPHAAQNEGWRRARGEFVAHLCHDDLWFPWHLSRLVAHLRASGADLAYDMAAEIDPPQVVVCLGEQVSFEHAVIAHMTNMMHRRAMANGQILWRDPYETGWAVNAHFLLSVQRAGCRIAFLEQLGSINFGSGTWNAYAATNFPQPRYLARLREDPHGLAMELLVANAARASRERDEDRYLTLGAALRRVARRWAWRAFNAWGAERTPALQLRRWQFARQRKRYNRQRGLPF